MAVRTGHWGRHSSTGLPGGGADSTMAVRPRMTPDVPETEGALYLPWDRTSGALALTCLAFAQHSDKRWIIFHFTG